MRRFLVILVVVAALATIATRSVEACSCNDLSMRRIFAHSEAVFLGEVVSIAYDSIPGTLEATSVTTLVVTESFKGPAAGDTVRVATSGTGGMCGVDFTRAPHYLVFADSAHQRTPMLETSICQLTRPASVCPHRLYRELRDWRRNGAPPDPPPARTGSIIHLDPKEVWWER